jgi:hypothetical protein
MKMSDTWYEEVEASESLTQGDIIEKCPILVWTSEPLRPRDGGEHLDLEGMVEAVETDVVIMTQACDLEQEKVANVVLCPHLSLSEYREVWEEAMRLQRQNPTQKSWSSHCRRICDGQSWNLTMLDAGRCETLSTEHRIVDFAEVFTVPRRFLESFLEQRGELRLRLRPPYREHLSQAFARYFMRVGLPVGVTPAW